MKKLAQATAVLVLFGSLYAQADDRHHPQAGQAAGASQTSPSQGMGMGMMDMDRMQEMHKMMERIQKTENPAERQQLMNEHMEQMHKMMGEMHGMMDKGMDEKTMVKRMNMMQGMMEQMMEHMMAAEGAKPAPEKGAGAADEHGHEKQGK